MPTKSKFQIDIPSCNILDYVFEKTPSDTPIWIDAEDPSKSLSPKQLLTWIHRLGNGLSRVLQPRDVVMMHSMNHIHIPIAYLGLAGGNYIFSGCSPFFNAAETKYQIENTGAKLILCHPTSLTTVLETGFPRDRIYMFSDEECHIPGFKDWRALLGEPEWEWPKLDGQNTTAVLNYSSGTTGLPKGVMISHQNIIANVEQSIFMRNLQSKPMKETWLGFLPLYHAYGQLWSITAAVRLMTPVYIMQQFNYVPFLQFIQKYRVTHIQTAPPVVVMLSKRPETKDYDLSSLQNILCGAAPLSKELQNDVSDRLKVKIVQTWGMTEVTCSSLHVPGGMDDRTGRAGLIDPNCEIKLISDAGEEVGVGERGEIYIRGPNICQGYWKNEEATKSTWEDGFMKTGDVAIRDEEGFFWIVDRKKELIKVKGFQVAPAELEAVLLTSPHVADAAVVGINLDHEEMPRAYVVPSEEAKKTGVKEEDIQEWMATQVAKHKQLTGGVKFIDLVPKSASGKIQRVIMRQWAARDLQKIKAKL